MPVVAAAQCGTAVLLVALSSGSIAHKHDHACTLHPALTHRVLAPMRLRSPPPPPAHAWQERLALALCAELGLSERRAAQLTREERAALLDALTGYPLAVSGDEGYKKAEVTGGGLGLAALDCSTMELRVRVWPGARGVGMLVVGGGEHLLPACRCCCLKATALPLSHQRAGARVPAAALRCYMSPHPCHAPLARPHRSHSRGCTWPASCWTCLGA